MIWKQLYFVWLWCMFLAGRPLRCVHVCVYVCIYVVHEYVDWNWLQWFNQYHNRPWCIDISMYCETGYHSNERCIFLQIGIYVTVYRAKCKHDSLLAIRIPTWMPVISDNARYMLDMERCMPQKYNYILILMMAMICGTVWVLSYRSLNIWMIIIYGLDLLWQNLWNVVTFVLETCIENPSDMSNVFWMCLFPFPSFMLATLWDAGVCEIGLTFTIKCGIFVGILYHLRDNIAK